MRPDEHTYDEWREIFFKSKKGTDEWWDAFDNLPLTAKCSEDWQDYAHLLDYEGFRFEGPSSQKFRPETQVYLIATNGILMAPRMADLDLISSELKKRRGVKCLVVDYENL